MIRRLGYDEPLPSKAWVKVDPSQSVPGTEDDETFYLPLEARKERARQYVKANHERIRKVAHEWYLKNRERWLSINSKWQKRRYRSIRKEKKHVQG